MLKSHCLHGFRTFRAPTSFLLSWLTPTLQVKCQSAEVPMLKVTGSEHLCSSLVISANLSEICQNLSDCCPPGQPCACQRGHHPTRLGPQLSGSCPEHSEPATASTTWIEISRRTSRDKPNIPTSQHPNSFKKGSTGSSCFIKFHSPCFHPWFSEEKN